MNGRGGTISPEAWAIQAFDLKKNYSTTHDKKCQRFLSAGARRSGSSLGQQKGSLVLANLSPVHDVLGSVNSLSDAHFGRKDEWVSFFF